MNKALIALSGGVDSSVAAYLIKQRGFDCVGITMKLFTNEDIGINKGKTCCSLDDVEDARSVAYMLGIPFYVFNFTEDFKKQVIGRFIDAYQNGRTPNPCMETTRLLRRMTGDEKALVAISFAPFSLAAMLLGVQQYMEMLLDEDDGIDELSAFALDMTIRFTQAFVDAGAEIVFVCDPVASGDLISPVVFEEHVLPLLRQITETYEKQNVPVMLHICGNTAARLEPLCGSGFASFSLDSVDLRTALDTSRGHYTIMGNMSPSAVILQMKSNAIEAHCRKLIDEAADDGHFIMMPGCDLGPLTPIENVQAMVNAAHNK